jgi:hypothetical protein
MKYTNTYEERQSVPDMADEAMQNYLVDSGLVEYKDWLKVGTDPKENKLDLFYYVTDILLIPDYVVVGKGLIHLMEVKGTLKLKEADYLKMKKMYDIAKDKKRDKVRVWLVYFANPEANPVMWTFKTIKMLWESDKLEEHYYPEVDVDGNKKMYKILPETHVEKI